MCLTKAGKNGTTSSSDYIYKTQSPDYTKLEKEKKTGAFPIKIFNFWLSVKGYILQQRIIMYLMYLFIRKNSILWIYTRIGS